VLFPVRFLPVLRNPFPTVASRWEKGCCSCCSSLSQREEGAGKQTPRSRRETVLRNPKGRRRGVCFPVAKQTPLRSKNSNPSRLCFATLWVAVPLRRSRKAQFPFPYGNRVAKHREFASQTPLQSVCCVYTALQRREHVRASQPFGKDGTCFAQERANERRELLLCLRYSPFALKLSSY
jgi:hypothetical protein